MTTALGPSTDVDLFSDEAIREPYEHYRQLRGLGPAVWLERHRVWALARYGEVRAALEDWQTWSSASGVALNDYTNETIRGTTLASDPPLHDHLRSVIGERLTPRSLRGRRPQIEGLARELVDRLVVQGSFDAVSDLARVLPMLVVPDFLGWPAEIRDKLLPWAGAAFDTMGPTNARCLASKAGRGELVQTAMELAGTHALAPDSLGADVCAAARRGDVTEEQLVGLLLDYLVPALDTTISAVGSAIWLFGRYPDQWDLVRADPALLPNAFHEVLRVESPVRCFSRVATRDVAFDGGATVRTGERALLIFASANRDERQWDRPEEFDVTRDAIGQLAFGYGVHGCAGQGLARLEAHALLGALARRVERFEVGPAVPLMNNVIRALVSLPVTVVADGGNGGPDVLRSGPDAVLKGAS